jgi:hypothetical protein
MIWPLRFRQPERIQLGIERRQAEVIVRLCQLLEAAAHDAEDAIANLRGPNVSLRDAEDGLRESLNSGALSPAARQRVLSGGDSGAAAVPMLVFTAFMGLGVLLAALNVTALLFMVAGGGVVAGSVAAFVAVTLHRERAANAEGFPVLGGQPELEPEEVAS